MKRRISLEVRLAVAVLIATTPAMVYWAIQLSVDDASLGHWLLWLSALCLVLWVVRSTHHAVINILRSITNVVESIRKGDFTMRVREDCFGAQEEMAREINGLANILTLRSMRERESSLLLGKIMDEIELAVLTLDAHGRLALVNPAAIRLLGEEAVPGQSLRRLGLSKLLDDSRIASVVDLDLPGGQGRYSVRRRLFRMSGESHTLLVLADLSQPLRAEQQQAWKRLVRVLGHEINNSLAPIKSIAQTLVNVAQNNQQTLSSEDSLSSLKLIVSRADALGRFVAGYATLARLPEPSLVPMSLNNLVRRVIGLEHRIPVQFSGPDIQLIADSDQLEQALINLLRNAVDVTPPGAEVTIRWQVEGGGALLEVIDCGPGPPESDNLFVPFFTTKPGGSGIGLLLARRIVENHRGWLNLVPRHDGDDGAVARLWLPNLVPDKLKPQSV